MEIKLRRARECSGYDSSLLVMTAVVRILGKWRLNFIDPESLSVSSGKDGRKVTIKLHRSGESIGHDSSGKDGRKVEIKFLEAYCL